MPKTGSQTVEATLQTCGLPHPIVRVHFLSRALAARVRAGLSEKSTGEWAENVRQQLRQSGQIRRLLRLRRWLRRCGVQVPKVEAISAVREPIGLGLAAIFENYLHLFNHLESATLEACKKELLRPRDHKFVHQWFELELEAMLGIDVYQKAFPREQGYDIYESRDGRGLVLRFEALPRLPQILADFLRIPVPEMVSRNVAADKQYAPVYNRAKQTLKLPADFVRAQCQCRLMRHFYSDSERQQFEAHWTEAPNVDLATSARR